MQPLEFCKAFGITEDQFYGKTKIEGDLYLGSVTALPENCALTVGGSLYLGSVTTLPENCALTVGGSLNLGSVTTLPENCALTVGGSLYLRSVTTLPENCALTVGGSLDLSSVTTLPENCALTVGGDLDLRSVTTLPENCALTVGGYLNLKNEKRYVGNAVRVNLTLPELNLLSWQNGKYVKADGIFTETIERKGRLLTAKKIGKSKVFYLYTDNRIHAHGDTPEQAKADYRFKVIAHKLKNTPIEADTVIP